MYKELFVLGLLRRQPNSGYNIHQMIRAHGDWDRDLRKANLYYMLTRLAVAGLLEPEPVKTRRGATGEKIVYSVTAAGEERFQTLLGKIFRTTLPTQTPVDVATVLLGQLPHAQATELLAQRRASVAAYQRKMRKQLGDPNERSVVSRIAAEHKMGLIEAELAWLDKARALLEQHPWKGANDGPAVRRVGRKVSAR